MNLPVALFFETVAIALYAFAPGRYSQAYCAVLFGIFVIETVWFIRKTASGNYFNFHVLFIFGYFLVHFAYPVFIYPKNPFYFYIFRSEFNHSLITASTALALLGMCSYILGGSLFANGRKSPQRDFDGERYRTFLKPLLYLSVGLFVLFVYFSRNTVLRGVFNAYSTTSVYILIAFQTILALTIILAFVANMRRTCGKWSGLVRIFGLPLLAFSLFVFLLFLYIGDRGPAMQIVLIYGALLAMFVKPVKFKVFALVAILGMFLMMFVSYARRTSDYRTEGTSFITEYYNRGKGVFTIGSVFDLGRDMIVNNRNLYLAVDYVEKNGVTYGRTLLAQIISVFPGMGSLYINLFNVEMKDISSGQMLTYHEYEGGQRGAGIGNTIIADVYISFGLLGVIIMMMVFGYWNAKFLGGASDKTNIYCIIAYAVSMSFAIYYSRSGFFIAFRSILWPILIVWFFNLIQKKNYRQRKILPASRVAPIAETMTLLDREQ